MDNEGEFQVELDSFVLDCADVFAAMVMKEYPDTDFELLFAQPAIWRPQWHISIPKDAPYNLEDVDDLAHSISMNLFKDHGVLVAYSVSRAQDDEDNEAT